jgi:hypothetical protein
MMVTLKVTIKVSLNPSGATQFKGLEPLPFI